MVGAKLPESKHGDFSAVGAIVRATDDVNSQVSHADRYTRPRQTVQTKDRRMMQSGFFVKTLHLSAKPSDRRRSERIPWFTLMEALAVDKTSNLL